MGAIIKRNNLDHLNLVERGKRTITSASLSQGLLTDDTVKLSVISSTTLDVKINDTLKLFGSTYRINTLPTVRKSSESEYQYEITAQGLMYDLLRCKFFNADDGGFKTTTNFPLIGNLETFLLAVRNNMRRFSADWEIGTVAETETKMITFGDDTCLSALQKICSEFKTDFWVKTDAGKFKIFTGAFGSQLPINLEYGKGKGLYEISRSNVNDNDIINRLYVNGGTQNIPTGYRNFSDNLKFSDAGFIESPALIAEFGLKEGSITFEEIYPKRTGTITALGDSIFKFRDSSMDFDLNEKNVDGATKYLIAGTTAKVHFNTGNLAGYQFEVKKGGYDHTKKEFEILSFKNETGQTFPDADASVFQFEVGDEYVLLDIVMPETYITNAEAELLTKGQEQFALHSNAKVSYDVVIDAAYVATLPTLPSIGDYVRVIDAALGVDKVIRIQQITRNFITENTPTPYDLKITLADDYELNYSSQMVLDIKEIKNIVNITKLGEINLSKIGYKTTEELKNLIFDTDGYFDAENIKPFSIETSMLAVGAQSQQLSCSVVFIVNDGGNPNQVEIKAGALHSQTQDITWTIAGSIVTFPDIEYRYVYAKCSKTSTTGSIYFSQEQLQFDEDANDFYFLLGILHTVVEGVRVLSLTYGTTTINGGLIRTGTISSLDGQTYFNLNTGEIKGKITFTNDSPAFEQINSAIVIGGRNFALGTKTPKNQAVGWIVYPLSTDMTSGDYVLTYDYTAAAFNGIGISLGDAGGYDGAYEYLGNVQKGTWKFSEKITFVRTNQTHLVIYVNAQTEIRNLKLEKGTKATDWTPAPEDVEAEIQNVQNYAETVNGLVSDIASDNKLTPTEKQQLKKEFDIIVAEKPQVEQQSLVYGALVSPYTTAYINAYSNLNTFVSPLLVNLNNTSNVDGVTLRSRFTIYYTAKINLLKAITDLVNNNLSSIWNEVANINTLIENEMNDVRNSISTLDNYVNGAFSDGIISQAEAVAIEKYINQLNAEKVDVENQYNQIIANQYLSGTPKTNLQNQWGTFNNYYNSLINSINDAIADGATTPVEKANVDAHFGYYRNSLGLLTQRFQEATKAIETSMINAIQIGGRNLLLNTDFKENINHWKDLGLGGLLSWNSSEKAFEIDNGSNNNGGTFQTLNQLEKGEYTMSFDVKPLFQAGANYAVLSIIGGTQKTVNIHTDNVWKRYSFTINTQAIDNYLIIEPINARQRLLFKNIKLEKGNKATDWTPAPEDIDVAIAGANGNAAVALAQAQNAVNTAAAAAQVTDFLTKTTINGNTVATGTLLVGDANGANAMISGVTDRQNGESIRFAAGKNYANKYLSPFQVLDNGMVRFVNPLTGQKTFELGFNQNTGKVVFDIYNDSGIKIASIGANGIEFTGYIPESYKKFNLRKLTTTSFIKGDIEAELKTGLHKFLVAKAPTPTTPDNNWRQYNIGVNSNYTAYNYNEGRNFESADNAKYTGFYKTANKFDEFIPNGIYVRQFIFENKYTGNINGNPINPGDKVLYPTEAWKFQNGKIIGSLVVYVDILINNITTRPTDFPQEDYEQ